MYAKAGAYVGLSLFAIYNIVVQLWWINEGDDGRNGGWPSGRVCRRGVVKLF